MFEGAAMGQTRADAVPSAAVAPEEESIDDFISAGTALALFRLSIAAVMMETGSLPDKRISHAC